ncbi:hypothetical protein [Azospirillum melinis]
MTRHSGVSRRFLKSRQRFTPPADGSTLCRRIREFGLPPLRKIHNNLRRDFCCPSPAFLGLPACRMMLRVMHPMKTLLSA